MAFGGIERVVKGADQAPGRCAADARALRADRGGGAHARHGADSRAKAGPAKELVARAIHERGAAGGAPFVAFNCAAFPKDLIESELFGYRRGGRGLAPAARLPTGDSAVGGTGASVGAAPQCGWSACAPLTDAAILWRPLVVASADSPVRA